jgi:serine/threonine protein kinase
MLSQLYKVNLVGFSYGTTRICIPETVAKDPMTAFDPPESLLGKPSFGIYYDYWALGVLLYTLLVGTSPWTGDTPKELYRAMSSGSVLRPRDMSIQAHNLILSLLDFEPLRRFSPAQVRAHAWLLGERAKTLTKVGSVPKHMLLKIRRPIQAQQVPLSAPGLTWG